MLRAFYKVTICIIVTGVSLGAQQRGGGTLIGRVTDRTTGQALGRAQVILFVDGRAADTDSLGRYRLSHVPLGVSRIVVRSMGFIVQDLSVRFDVSGEQRLDVAMDSTAKTRAAMDLPAIDVSATAPTVSYRLTAFERRRKTGRGQYLTEDQIVNSGAFNVADAVKHLRGVIYECPSMQCRVRMTRAPMRCMPEYVVDEQVMNDFGPHTPIRDVVGIEVYTGPTDVPGEYAGRNAGCGVIVIHTRAGPRQPSRQPS